MQKQIEHNILLITKQY